MNWIQLVGAFGLGAIIIKIMDALWINKIIENSEKKKWLRDNRLKCFSELSGYILSLGLKEDIYDNPFKLYAKIASSMLLINDERLVSEIDNFVVRLDKMHAGNINEDEKHKLYNELSADARLISNRLRLLIINDK